MQAVGTYYFKLIALNIYAKIRQGGFTAIPASLLTF